MLRFIFEPAQSFKEEHQKPLVQVCRASPQRSFTNCFGFKCSVNAEKVNGVPLATCHCPIDDDVSGNPVPRGSSAFKNEAGRCWAKYLLSSAGFSTVLAK